MASSGSQPQWFLGLARIERIKLFLTPFVGSGIIPQDLKWGVVEQFNQNPRGEIIAKNLAHLYPAVSVGSLTLQGAITLANASSPQEVFVLQRLISAIGPLAPQFHQSREELKRNLDLKIARSNSCHQQLT